MLPKNTIIKIANIIDKLSLKKFKLKIIET